MLLGAIYRQSEILLSTGFASSKKEAAALQVLSPEDSKGMVSNHEIWKFTASEFEIVLLTGHWTYVWSCSNACSACIRESIELSIGFGLTSSPMISSSTSFEFE